MAVWLVTGGAGFIGSNFIYFLLKTYPGDRVICFDALTYCGNLKTLDRAMADSRFVFIQGDITDPAAVNLCFEAHKPDYVVNFAAESHVDRSIRQPDIFIKTNVSGVQVLMDACRTYGCGRFHQVSTDEVYGDLPLDRPDLKFTEESPLQPSSPYSASKASADLLVQAYFRTFKLPVSISRCSNNYGPFHFPEKLIPLTITNALHDKRLPVYGDGQNVRDWLYVNDHCRAIDMIVRSGKPGSLFNVGGGSEYANISIVGLILEKLNKPQSLIEFVADRHGHDLRYAIDASKIRSELGWEPLCGFDEGINQTLDWYLNNKDWWCRLVADG